MRIISAPMIRMVTKYGVLVAALLLSACATQRSERLDAADPARVQSDVPNEHVSRPKRQTSKTITSRKASQAVSSPMLDPAKFVAVKPGNRIAQVSVPGKYVALTFDDGPNPLYTPKVLDILKRYNAKATFFVLGENAARHKQILARAVSEGHEIGSHTWSHAKLTACSPERLVSELERTNAVIREATGSAPKVMRPPYGATNPEIIAMTARRYGMPSILWDVDTVDWRHPGVSVVIERAVKKAKSGSIILLHDIHGSTLEAVEGVVSGLIERGFKLVTVSELVEMARRAAREAEESVMHTGLVEYEASSILPGESAELSPQPLNQGGVSPDSESALTQPAVRENLPDQTEGYTFE